MIWWGGAISQQNFKCLWSLNLSNFMKINVPFQYLLLPTFKSRTLFFSLALSSNCAKSIQTFISYICNENWIDEAKLVHYFYIDYLLERSNFETSQFSCAQCAFKVINIIVCIAISYRFWWLMGHNAFVSLLLSKQKCSQIVFGSKRRAICCVNSNCLHAICI